MVFSLPPKIIFLDTETTGLSSNDRIVSFAGILLHDAEAKNGGPRIETVHLIFNPGRPSHPMAQRAHGHDDSTLSHQNPFKLFASDIRDFIHQADLMVAHNADFDLKFLNREMKKAKLPQIETPSFCTMEAWRDTGRGGPATLDAVAKRFGVARKTKQHSPLEDSWLAMRVFLALHDSPLKIEFASLKCPPSNWVEPEPDMAAAFSPG